MLLTNATRSTVGGALQPGLGPHQLVTSAITIATSVFPGTALSCPATVQRRPRVLCQAFTIERRLSGREEWCGGVFQKVRNFGSAGSEDVFDIGLLY
jgi:hypothetical protein